MSSRSENEPEVPAWFADARFRKADLHCHSVYSTFKYFRIANTRDSYNRPEEVYRLAKERGLRFVFNAEAKARYEARKAGKISSRTRIVGK